MKITQALGTAAAVFGISFAVTLAGAVAPANAQSGDTITAQQAIHNLKADYGVVVIPADGIKLDTPVSASVLNVNGSTPTQAMDALANDMNARVQKLFIVVPASAEHPVTTLADASAWRAPGSTVTLQLTDVPAKDAIHAVAAAANATVDLRADVGQQTVSITGTDLDVAQAIAAIAAQTNTAWIPAYELMPRPQSEMAGAVYHRRLPLVSMYVNQGPTGPVIVHNAPTPPPAPATASEQPAPSTANQEASAVASGSALNNQAAQSTPVVPTNPYGDTEYAPYGYDPYGGYYMMQNGYGYTPYGTPYPDTYGGFTNGGFSPSPGLDLLPYGPGAGYYGTAPVFGGGTSTTAGF